MKKQNSNFCPVYNEKNQVMKCVSTIAFLKAGGVEGQSPRRFQQKAKHFLPSKTQERVNF